MSEKRVSPAKANRPAHDRDRFSELSPSHELAAQGKRRLGPPTQHAIAAFDHLDVLFLEREDRAIAGTGSWKFDKRAVPQFYDQLAVAHVGKL